jgi:hypothetical protein
VDLFGKGSGMRFSRDLLLSAALVFFTIWGLVIKFVISLNLRLDSDAVGMGIMSMEIGKHHNFLLSGCHLLSSDSFVFTELAPFQLVPQILTNYSPAALRVMVFFVFIMSLLAMAYLVWLVSKSRLSALLFCALAAAVPPEGYSWLAYPSTHNATILFGAVILILVFSVCRPKKEQKQGSRKSRKKAVDETPAVTKSYTLILAALAFLSVFSDTIILVWVLIPLIITYLVLIRKESRKMDFVVIAVALMSAIAYIIKTYFMVDWLRTDYSINSIPVIVMVNSPLFIKALFLFLSQGLYALVERGTSIGPEEVFLSVLFIGVIFCCAKSGWSGRKNINPEKKLFFTLILLSVLMMAAAFTVSGYVYHITAARYLSFTALALLMLVAVSCPVTEKTCAVFVLMLLSISSVAGSMYISSMDTSANGREYDLIRFLKDRNLTFGYGTYWNSNIITYLSGEDVTVRATYIAPDDLLPDLENSCSQWYAGRPDRFFLIYDMTRPDEASQKNYHLLTKSGNASDVLHYRDYEVFLFHPA